MGHLTELNSPEVPMSTNFALIGVTVALIALAAYLWLPLVREPKYVGRHWLTPDTPTDAVAWLDATNHNAPHEPFSPDEAHLAMQQHRECSAARCERKGAAFDTLTGIGAIKPRTR